MRTLKDFTVSAQDGPPSRLGKRYTADQFLPEAGNTIVCHLDFDHPAHTAILKARTRLQALPGADGFVYTPESSLHMTVFEGVIETRRTPDAWPAGIDRDAPIDQIRPVVADRLETFAPPPSFAVRPVQISPVGLRLEGATPDDVDALKAWREALTVPFGYRHHDHDAYRHHMTFAYPVAWIPDEHLAVWERETNAILTDLLAQAPTIPLTAPAFCTFADMTAFPQLKVLR